MKVMVDYIYDVTGKVIAMPDRDDIDLTIQEHQIVELYSK